MSTNEVDATPRPAPPSPRRGLREFADRWPFRRKLNLLVGVPLAVVAALLSYLIAQQVGQSRDAAAAADLVRNSEQVASLVNKVENEHQLAILLSVRYEAGGKGVESTRTAYRTAQRAVDAQIAKVRSGFGGALPDSEAQALKEVEGLTSLRGTVEQSYLPASNIDPAYDNAASTVIDGLGLDRNPELAATFTGNLLDSLLRADAAHGSFETGVFSATTGDTNAQIEFTTAVGAYELYNNQAERFTRFATAVQADELTGVEHTSAMRNISEAYAELQVAPSTLQATTPSDIKAAFQDALTDYPSYPEQAASRLKITSSLIGQIAHRADSASSDASWRAGLLISIGLFGFALWIAFSILVRRSVVRPVMALTGAAQEVADVAGRELARVADDDEDDSPPRLMEMPVTARDEIGALAEVFNRVQTTAIALLERQVLSRRNVAEMFGNVGRRVSNLTTRQLALIDAVERGETDPAILERLYSIDHIAVRLRRNADSLMLLAGIRETVLDSGPTALTNVVRAALGQIEGFQRVRLHARTEVMVEPDIIGDLTLMVAELIENAVSFSPVGSPVEAYVRDTSGEESAGGAAIVIADHGLGMSAERLAEENARLIRRERLDVVPTKVLGLFVVGALARRWDIAVTLSRTPGGGVTAEVTVPPSLLLAMSPVGVAGGSTARRDSVTGSVSDPVSGPRPSAAVGEETRLSPDAPRNGHPLPRRVPRRETPADPEPSTPGTDTPTAPADPPATERTPFVPQARGETTPHSRPSWARDTAPTGPSTTDSRHVRDTAPSPEAQDTPRPRWDEASLPARPDRAEPDSRPAQDAAPSGSTEAAPRDLRPAQDAAASHPTKDAPLPRWTEAEDALLPRSTGAAPRPRRTDDTPDSRPAQDAAPAGSTEAAPRDSRPAQDTTPSHPTEDAPRFRRTEDAHPSHPIEEAPGFRWSEDATPSHPADGATPSRQSGVGDWVSSGGVRGGESALTAEVRGGVTSPVTEPGPSAPSSGDGPARPLRRRVRGATLRTTVDAAAQHATRQLARPADADAVRDALDEFEAAVERANRDSAATPGNDAGPSGDGARPTGAAPHPSPDPHDQNHLPEGAEQ